MKSLFIQKKSFLLLLGGLVIVSASLVYLFTAGNAFIQQPALVTPTTNVPNTPIAELTQSGPPKLCSSKHQHFQMGVAFPQWSPTGYGASDTKWLTELPDMRTQTAACWVEMPILLGKPIFISEIGYRNSADALYRTYDPSSSAPPDPVEQAAAYDAALANILPDQHILGSFFWGWDDAGGAFNLKGSQATGVIHKYYQTLQA